MDEKGKSEGLFGQPGDASKILEQAKKTMTGQAMSAEMQTKAKDLIAKEAVKNDTLEAAGFCEEIVAWLNKQWNEREFTAEQRIFSVALATINLREHFPEAKGGKELFDRVCSSAMEYFRKAQSS